MLPESLLVVDVLAKRLNALEIPYYIGGSIASSMYGIFRSTNDVDIVVALEEEQVDPLAASLDDDFYVDASMIREALRAFSSFNVIHLPTMIKADLFLPEPTPFRKSEWDRRRLEQIRTEGDMLPIYIASAEDMVLQKLDWYRLTGGRSDRQWGDVQGMLKVQGDDLDFDYLAYWAGELGLSGLLASAYEDAGLTPNA